jgi:hypothetical protein
MKLEDYKFKIRNRFSLSQTWTLRGRGGSWNDLAVLSHAKRKIAMQLELKDTCVGTRFVIKS